ncbi:unnamed protein product [Ceutorhynchus assimilis]|uniref:HIG1 domain-containing protein n=1 Tax=Ceutorhynchus assimilis TaxID=467358 RepID=A0A9N9MED9_9CUCU|nr:unnamed protein product [Ceutorhynchus assimilis]
MTMDGTSIELTDEDLAKFDWLDLHKEMNEKIPLESTLDKFMRKSKENPFVPIGAVATCGALFYGLWSLKKGEKRMSQYMMRTRVVAQGLTIAAVVGGYVFAVKK